MRGKEGGHSEFRILHYKDITGFEIERALVAESKKYPNIHIYNHWFVVDIITQHHLGYLVTKSTPDILAMVFTHSIFRITILKKYWLDLHSWRGVAQARFTALLLTQE